MPFHLRTSYVSILLILTGVFTFIHFRALPSIGIIALATIAVFHLFKTNNVILSRPIFSLGLIFILYLVSFPFTEPGNTNEAISTLLMKGGFLIFAFAFTILPPFSEKKLLTFYYYFYCITVLTALGTFANYILNYKEITDSYIASKVMPTPVNHVRYSLILAFSIIIGTYLYYKKFFIKVEKEKYILASGTIFLFAFIHILSVRSGLLALYVCVFLLTIYSILNKGWKKRGIAILFILIALPVLSYFFIPTFKNKIHNTLEDFNRISRIESANDYSLVGRIISYKVAWKIFRENPYFGVGPSNLESHVKKVYNADFPEINKNGIGYLMPHNQFLVILASTGIIGLIIFTLLFYAPLFLNYNYKYPLLLFHYIIITISFMFEGTLETQTGTNFTLIFIFLPLFFLKGNTVKPAHG